MNSNYFGETPGLLESNPQLSAEENQLTKSIGESIEEIKSDSSRDSSGGGSEQEEVQS